MNGTDYQCFSKLILVQETPQNSLQHITNWLSNICSPGHWLTAPLIPTFLCDCSRMGAHMCGSICSHHPWFCLTVFDMALIPKIRPAHTTEHRWCLPTVREEFARGPYSDHRQLAWTWTCYKYSNRSLSLLLHPTIVKLQAENGFVLLPSMEYHISWANKTCHHYPYWPSKVENQNKCMHCHYRTKKPGTVLWSSLGSCSTRIQISPSHKKFSFNFL